MITLEELMATVGALASRVAALEARVPLAPHLASRAEHDGGTIVTRGDPIAPMPAREFLDKLLVATRAAHPEVRPAEPRDLSDAHLEAALGTDFAICYHGLAHCPRRSDIDERTSVTTWIDRLMNWRMDNGLSNTSVWGAAFIYAALAHGDIQVAIGTPISTTKFALKQWAGGL
jgi:hypothetical protein